MVIKKIDHIGMVVKDLDIAVNVYSEALGLEVSMVEHSEEFNVKIAFLPVGEVLVELLQPTGPGMIRDFLADHGEGIHHICYEVPDIDRALKEVGRKLKLRDERPRPGGSGSLVAFLDPRTIFGVETEFVEKKKSPEQDGAAR